jgi:hypothetical protein
LQVLEKWGYVVRRVAGFSAIDFGRCAMAGEALRDGFEELMWIDSDTVFDPEAIVRLREHQLPFTGVLCPKKGQRLFACDFLPGTEKVLFGAQGGLMEVHYVGFGFVHTRREVYERMQQQLKLPVCNDRFGESIVPWFFPLIVDDGPDKKWYLQEDYAFCERARRVGYRIMVDTTIRLWHVGSYGYTWEDAGSDKPRYDNYTFHLTPPKEEGGK